MSVVGRDAHEVLLPNQPFSRVKATQVSARTAAVIVAAIPMVTFLFLRLTDIARWRPERYLMVLCVTLGSLSTAFGYLATGEPVLPENAQLVAHIQTATLLGFAVISLLQAGNPLADKSRATSQRVLVVGLYVYLLAGLTTGLANGELSKKAVQSVPWFSLVVVLIGLRPVPIYDVLRALQRLLMIPVWTSLLLLIQGDARFLLGPRRITSPFLDERLAGVAIHPNVLGTVAVSAFVMVWFGRSHTQWRRISLAVCVLVVWATDSRIALTALTIVVLGLWYRQSQSARRSYASRRLAKALTATAALTAACLLWLEIQNIRTATGDFSGRGRLWDVVAGSWTKEPLLGVGDNLLGGVPEESTRGLWFGDLSHMHNQILDALTRTGLFGLLTFLYLVFCLITVSREKGLALGTPLRLLLASMLAISVAEVPFRVGGLPMGVIAIFALLTLALSSAEVQVEPASFDLQSRDGYVARGSS